MSPIALGIIGILAPIAMAAVGWVVKLSREVSAMKRAPPPAPTQQPANAPAVDALGGLVSSLAHQIEMLAAKEEWRWTTIEKALTSHTEATKDLAEAVRELSRRS